MSSSHETVFAHYASRFVRFTRKPAHEQWQAARATVAHYYRSATGKAKRREDPLLALADFVPPRVFGSQSRFYIAYRPDSDRDFNQHPELHALSERWVRSNFSTTAGDLPRLYALCLNIKQVMADGIAGDFAELGVFRGNSAAVLAHYARQHGRLTFLFDTFDGFAATDLTGVDSNKIRVFDTTSLDLVRQNVGDDRVTYIKGHFPDSITSRAAERSFAVVHLDCDLYKPTRAALEFFYPRLSAGGLIIMHDYSNIYWKGAKQAIDEYMCQITESLILIPDKSGTAMIRKAQSRSPRGERGAEQPRP